MSSKFPNKVLMIDHDQMVMNQVETMLSKKQIPVVKAPNWEQALYHYNQNKIDLVISEMTLDGMPGTILVQKFRNHEVPSKRNPAIIITTSGPLDGQDSNLIKEFGDITLLKKPIKEATIIGLIAKAMEEAAQRNKVHELRINVLDPLLEKGQSEKAVQIAEKNLLPGGARSLFLASEVFEKAEHLERSLEITGKLLQDDSKNLSYINQLGRLKMKTGDFSDAKKYYEMADQLAPDNLERLEQMAAMYLKMKLPEQSIEKYKKLLEHSPEDPQLKYRFFQDLQDAGFEKQAQEFCKETTSALELIRHFNNRGVMFSKEGNYIDAIDEYEKARKLIPESKELYRILYNMAIAHINLKSKDHVQEADKILREVLTLKPDYQKASDKLKITENYLKKSA